MSGLVHRPLLLEGPELVVLDARRRLYAGLSRDGSYVHVVYPAALDIAGQDGAVVRRAGELTCMCKGAWYRGTCYRVEQAEAFEANDAQAFIAASADPALAWLDAAPGELVEAYGK